MARSTWRARSTIAVTLTATALAGLGAVAADASETADAGATALAPQTRSSVAVLDTHVTRSRPGRAYGQSRVVVVRGRGGQALVSAPTPEAPDGLQPVSAKLCVTPTRTTSTRLRVFPAVAEWDERTTWRTRPGVETSLLGTSTTRPVAGRRMCIALPVSALEEGSTEFRLQSRRQWRRAFLASSEAGPGRAPAVQVTFAPQAAEAPKPKPPSEPTPTETPTETPTTPTTSPTPTTPSGTVLWDGSFETGGVPHGANGPACGTGADDGPDSAADQYGSVEEMGNTACTNAISMTRSMTRTADSQRALKIVIASKQQREQPQSKYSWTPDAKGSVDHWYGFSMYYAPDWELGGGLLKEISGSYWHNPLAFRMVGDNGSLNFSGDMDLNNANGQPYTRFSEPHMVLRRNTVKNQQGFYTDGKGLDKIDLGPIVSGKWMDFVCHIRWSTTSTNALRECWRDGVYKGASTTVNTVAANKHYLRIGQYQETNISHSRTTYFDNVRIGTSYDAVDPSRAR